MVQEKKPEHAHCIGRSKRSSCGRSNYPLAQRPERTGAHSCDTARRIER